MDRNLNTVKSEIKSMPIGVSISPNNASICIFFIYNGVRCRERIRLEPNKTNLTYCANLRSEILSRIAKNDFDYAKYFPNSRLAKKVGFIAAKKLTSCGELFNQQLANYEKMVKNGYMSPSTYVGYKKVILGQLIPAFSKCKIEDLNASKIRAWLISLNKTPKTIRNYLTPLRNLFADALNDDLITANPLDRIALNKLIQVSSIQSEFIAEPFDAIEKQQIIDSASGQFKNFIQFGFWSGLRTSELIALKWVDIDFKKGLAHICRAKVCNIEKGTKTKSGVRLLILLPKALEALKNQLLHTKDSEYVFHNPNSNKAWSNSTKVSDHWRKLLLTLDVKYRNCYQMRHTFASTLLSNGENPWWVATQMGHVDVEMIFKKYGKWIPRSGNNGYEFVGNYN